MGIDSLTGLRGRRDRGAAGGIASVCSAHPLVIEAALLQARDTGGDVLIEATCNQVNHQGGYTGLTPAGFRDRVHGMADRLDLPRRRIILGGDHLGPSPWRHLPAGAAMAEAGRMVAAYAEAGFAKLHLDCSMGCAGETEMPSDAIVAGRAAMLAGIAERHAPSPPVYVIGTEVPVPGGAHGSLDHLAPTSPEALRATHAVHEAAFGVEGAAWERVIAIVVQPGVEFNHEAVAPYRPHEAAALVATLDRLPGLVFEAHSTDYQPPDCLSRLVADGFAILKVGPALTFALREALYGLDLIAAELSPALPTVRGAAEAAMVAQPGHWQSHYAGDAARQRLLRHFSYSDRIRYYLGTDTVGAAIEGLLDGLAALGPLPATLVSQYLPRLSGRVRDGAIDATPRGLVLQSVRDVLGVYAGACGTQAG